MKYNLLDNLILELSDDINNLALALEKAKSELEDLKLQKKEVDIQAEDMKKIVYSYRENDADLHSVFSPIAHEEEPENAIVKQKQKELETLQVKCRIVQEKYNAKQMEYSNLVKAIEKNTKLLKMTTDAKTDMLKQLEQQDNNAYMKKLKDIQQKKRLMRTEEMKYQPIIKKMNSEVFPPLNDVLLQMEQLYNFMQMDPVRAQQEMKQVYQKLRKTVDETSSYMEKLAVVEDVSSITEKLKEYIARLTKIYPAIKFAISTDNFQVIDNINADLNRCLITIYRSLLNCLILYNNPKEINLKFAYENGMILVSGNITGTYVNYYNKMKASAEAVISNLYQKIFLMDGVLIVKDNKDGSFMVHMNIPLKTYLVQ